MMSVAYFSCGVSAGRGYPNSLSHLKPPGTEHTLSAVEMLKAERSNAGGYTGLAKTQCALLRAPEFIVGVDNKPVSIATVSSMQLYYHREGKGIWKGKNRKDQTSKDGCPLEEDTEMPKDVSDPDELIRMTDKGGPWWTTNKGGPWVDGPDSVMAKTQWPLYADVPVFIGGYTTIEECDPDDDEQCLEHDAPVWKPINTCARLFRVLYEGWRFKGSMKEYEGCGKVYLDPADCVDPEKVGEDEKLKPVIANEVPIQTAADVAKLCFTKAMSNVKQGKDPITKDWNKIKQKAAKRSLAKVVNQIYEVGQY